MLNWTVGEPPIVSDPPVIEPIRPLTCGGEEALPLFLKKSNPSRRNFVRETSITFTCNSTCCTPLTVMLLMILSPG